MADALTISATAGDEYRSFAPAEVRILGRAKTCEVITDHNEQHMLKVAAAIVALGTDIVAAVAEAIQYEATGSGAKSVEEWAALPLLDVPVMDKKYTNYRAVRDAGSHNAIVLRSREIVAAM